MKISNLRAKFKPKGCKGNIHFGKIILALMLISAIAAIALGNVRPVMASEELYYYDKYRGSWSSEEKRSYEYRGVNYGEFIDAWFENDPNRGKYEAYGSEPLYSSSKGYYSDSNTFYTSSGWRVYNSPSERKKIYFVVNSGATKYEARRFYYAGRETIYTRTAQRGDLIQENIIGTSDQYPSYGIHSDGYFYIRRGLVPPNTNPTLIISSPNENSYFV